MQQVREKVLEARMGEGNLQAAGTACANTWVGVQMFEVRRKTDELGVE